MKTISYLVAILAVLVMSGLGSAQTIEVGKGYDYGTIAEGVNAANSGDLVLVHEGVYSINSTIFLKSGISISGEGGNKTIIYTDSFSDIASESNPAMLGLKGVSNIEISNLTFLGPAKSRQEQHSNGGTTSIGGLREARNGIKLQDASGINIHDCYFSMLLSDGIRSSESENVNIYNCRFESAGHDSISMFHSNNYAINNCKFDLMINTCIRFDGVTGASVTNSTFIQTTSSTGAGYIELENRADQIIITRNAFLQSDDPVLWRANPDGGNVQLIDNVYYGVEGPWASYSPYTVTLKNNTLFASERDWAGMGYGYNASTVTENVIKWIDDGKGSHHEEIIEPDTTETFMETFNENCTEVSCTDERCTEGNCTPANESTATGETAVSNTITAVFDELCAKYLDFSSESAVDAATMANESAVDVQQAEVLLNGSTEDQELGKMYLESGELKLKYAQDMMNLSQKSLDEAKNRLNNTEG